MRNIVALALRELRLSYEHIPQLHSYRYDFARNAIVDGRNEEVQPREIRDLLARVDPDFAHGIGLATAARAIATRSALRWEGSAGNNSLANLREFGARFADRYQPLYARSSRAAQPENARETDRSLSKKASKSGRSTMNIVGWRDYRARASQVAGLQGRI